MGLERLSWRVKLLLEIVCTACCEPLNLVAASYRLGFRLSVGFRLPLSLSGSEVLTLRVDESGT